MFLKLTALVAVIAVEVQTNFLISIQPIIEQKIMFEKENEKINKFIITWLYTINNN